MSFREMIVGAVEWAAASFGSVISAFFDSDGAFAPLLPAIGLSIGFAVCFMGVRLIKSVIKGY